MLTSGTFSVMAKRNWSLTLIIRIAIALTLLTSFLLTGCSRIRKEGAEPPSPAPVELKMTFNKPVYQIGEAVICRVHLVNNQNEDLDVPPPFVTDKAMESNIKFSVRNLATTAVLSYLPVHPENAAPPASLTIKSGTELVVTFVFTNLTHGEGQFALSATYTVPVSKTQDLIHSAPVNIEVKGPRLWNRDRDDILVKADAIKVAAAKYGKPVKSAQAKLVINEAGFLDWYVSLEKMSFDAKAGESDHIGYFVSPYNPFVRAPAPPSMPKLFEKAQTPKPDIKPHMQKSVPAAASQSQAPTAPAQPAAPSLPPGFSPVK